MAEILLIGLAVIITGIAIVYFMGTPFGMQLIHKQSVRTILYVIKAKQGVAPHKPLHEIYFAVAEERSRFRGVADYAYLHFLKDAGCFDSTTLLEPEQFAELLATLEDKIKVLKAGT